jgi:hypothetical protein
MNGVPYASKVIAVVLAGIATHVRKVTRKTSGRVRSALHAQPVVIAGRVNVVTSVFEVHTVVSVNLALDAMTVVVALIVQSLTRNDAQRRDMPSRRANGVSIVRVASSALKLKYFITHAKIATSYGHTAKITTCLLSRTDRCLVLGMN